MIVRDYPYCNKNAYRLFLPRGLKFRSSLEGVEMLQCAACGLVFRPNYAFKRPRLVMQSKNHRSSQK